MNTVYYAREMDFENRKVVFKYLLRSLFLDDKALSLKIDDNHIIEFYSLLIEELKNFSEQKAEKDDNAFFLAEVIISLLASFHIMDKSFLTNIIMHPLSMEAYLKMDSIIPSDVYRSNSEFNIAIAEIRNLYFHVKSKYFS